MNPDYYYKSWEDKMADEAERRASKPVDVEEKMHAAIQDFAMKYNMSFNEAIECIVTVYNDSKETN